MTKVPRSRAPAAHPSATLDRSRAVSRKKKPYKIVLEAVTQEKRKVHTILSYHDQAPPGFGYIPVGYPEITEWCKEQCRQRNLDVHIVSAKPTNNIHRDPKKISFHVHRIGHHFPMEIIELACSKFGYEYTEKDGLVKVTGTRTSHGQGYIEREVAHYQSRQALHGRSIEGGNETKDMVRGAVREIFPKIPDADVEAIVDHAFAKGADRVGNTDLPLPRRVQLAVVAHIRHTYTEYDKILKSKTVSWREARTIVEPVSLAKLKEWRDEIGEASHELEETFREVIVLDDDEEEDISDVETPKTGTRGPSMEFISSRATARDLQPETIDLTNEGASYAMRAPRRTVYLPALPHPSFPSISSHHHASFHRDDVRASRVESRRAEPEFYEIAHPRPADLRRLPVYAEPPPPKQARLADGQLYNLQPVEEVRREERTRRDAAYDYDYAPATMQRLVREDLPSRLTRHSSRPALASSSRRASDQDLVLPSVEREPEAAPEQPFDRHGEGQFVSYAGIHTPKRKSFPSSVYSPQDAYLDQTGKRLRPLDDDPHAQSFPKAMHHHQPTNLAFSPMRLTYDDQREMYAVSSNQAHAQRPAREWPRGHVLDYDRPYDGRAMVPVEYGASRAGPTRRPIEDDRYRLR